MTTLSAEGYDEALNLVLEKVGLRHEYKASEKWNVENKHFIYDGSRRPVAKIVSEPRHLQGKGSFNFLKCNGLEIVVVNEEFRGKVEDAFTELSGEMKRTRIKVR